MEKKQTAVEWLYERLERMIPRTTLYNIDKKIYFEKAKQMEKKQMDNVSVDWWNEGASYMYDGKRKYDSFEQYYNETYGGEK
jgi:hypothetical protein